MGSDFSLPCQLFLTGAIVYMMVMFLNCMIEINWLHDGNRLVYLGPMMGIDRVQFHSLIGMDWAQNQSMVEIMLITLI